MKILAAFTLVMESFTMGFALLIAKDDASSLQVYLGAALAILLFIAAGLVRRQFGLQIGWVLQVCLIGYGLVVFAMYFLGILFAALWWCAIYFGRKGDAIKELRKSSVNPSAKTK